MDYLRGAGSMNVYAANYTMNPSEIFDVACNAANYTSDPFASPVYFLRSFLGL